MGSSRTDLLRTASASGAVSAKSIAPYLASVLPQTLAAAFLLARAAGILQRALAIE